MLLNLYHHLKCCFSVCAKNLKLLSKTFVLQGSFSFLLLLWSSKIFWVGILIDLCTLISQARIWDMRQLESGSSLYDLAHKRVVNSAYFSPLSGSKIVTTSQDNRIRVWDSIFGSLDTPSREIVHSHDFNRHLTPFRAEWDAKVCYTWLLLYRIFFFSSYFTIRGKLYSLILKQKILFYRIHLSPLLLLGVT